MTTVTEQPAPAAGSTGLGGPAGELTGPPETPSPTRTWLRSAVWPLVIVGLLVAAVVLSVLTSGQGNDLPLDPDGVGPEGSRAIAQVLDHHGVAVLVDRTRADAVRDAQAYPNATVVVSQTDRLSDADVAALDEMAATGRRTVLVAPDQRQLDALAPGVREVDHVDRTVVDAGCAQPVPFAAGRADAGGYLYESEQTPYGCYAVDGHPSYVVWQVDGRVTTVVGQPALFTNDRFAHEGNAALVLGTLGHNDHLIWFVPETEAVAGEQSSLGSLLPRWVGWVVLQLFLVVLVCMLWRGRRLGRLVPEQLPVVVRAVETTEGRARMYRRSRSRGRAAAILRDATMTRLRARTGLARGAPPAAVVAVVAARTGIPERDVGAMLLGPPPTDDAGLVRLAQTLDQLDREVRRP